MRAPSTFISDADRDLVQAIENIELGDDEAVEPVHLGGIAEQGNMEPFAAPRTTRDRAKLVSALTHTLTQFGQVWEGTRTDCFSKS